MVEKCHKQGHPTKARSNWLRVAELKLARHNMEAVLISSRKKVETTQITDKKGKDKIKKSN